MNGVQVEPTPSKARRRRCKNSTASFPDSPLLSKRPERSVGWGFHFVSIHGGESTAPAPLTLQLRESRQEQPMNESILSTRPRERGKEGERCQDRGRLKKANHSLSTQVARGMEVAAAVSGRRSWRPGGGSGRRDDDDSPLPLGSAAPSPVGRWTWTSAVQRPA